MEDASGRPGTGLVSVAISPNPCQWPLAGTTTVPANDGRATFDDLRFEQVAKGYVLALQHGSNEVDTNPFDVVDELPPGQGLEHRNTLCAKPNPQRDAESLVYVPEHDLFWLADDDSPSIFSVDPSSGRFRSRLTSADFLAGFPDAAACDDGDGDPSTTCSYVNELEQVEYDVNENALYVMNTVNAPVDHPAIFKLRRRPDSLGWSFETWKPLPLDERYDALVSIDGELFVAIGREIYRFDFETGSALTTDSSANPLPPAYTAQSRLARLHYDGIHLWTIHGSGELKKIEWETGTELASYDLRAMGLSRPAGLEIVGGLLYVLEGDPPNPIWVLEDSQVP